MPPRCARSRGDITSALKLSKGEREKIDKRVSWRGSMTMSRKDKRTRVRTSSASPRERWATGVFAAAKELGPVIVLVSKMFVTWGPEGGGLELRTGRAPQNSAASRELIIDPRPLNSRSSGRKTACIKGRIVPNTECHISTR